MKNKTQIKEAHVFNLVGGTIVAVLAFISILPFILIVSGSFSSETEIITKGYSILPRGFSLDAYKTIFAAPEKILYGYRNTIIYTTVGTGLGLFLTSMTGYVLSRKYFEWRNFFSFFIYFTTLFSGGLVPSYVWMNNLGAKNSMWVLVLPAMLSMFNIMIMRNFIASIPEAIAESAKIDGANEFIIYLKLIVPLIKPAMATVGLFLALNYWNAWHSCMLYITDEKLYTLQYNLYQMLNRAEEIKAMLERGAALDPNMVSPAETVKLAMTCIVTGPIILLYPYVQKYFIKGITVGAVKG